MKDEDRAKAVQKVLERFRRGDETNPVHLAVRFGLSHTYVRKVLREAGLMPAPTPRKGKTK